MVSPNNQSTIRVSSTKIVQIFNDSQHSAAIANGEYRREVVKEEVLKGATCDAKAFPRGTRSLYIRYYDADGNWVVGMHMYLLPDGSIGASGLEDPKHVVIDDTIFEYDDRL